ncbi:hypothetical protein MTO96_023414 [Rhipicephalus appendiculatus]
MEKPDCLKDARDYRRYTAAPKKKTKDEGSSDGGVLARNLFRAGVTDNPPPRWLRRGVHRREIVCYLAPSGTSVSAREIRVFRRPVAILGVGHCCQASPPPAGCSGKRANWGGKKYRGVVRGRGIKRPSQRR